MSYEILTKDGTSQKSRTMKSLNPLYVKVDERRLTDWLKIVRKLASLIKYDDGSGTTSDITWESFIDWDSVQLDLKDIQGYVDNPSLMEQEPEKKRWLSRPHFVLLITFLKLLEHPQKAVNGFTKRHLDFYYREFLQFRNQRFTPDSVHVTAMLEEGAGNFIFKKGTRLKGGKGPAGEDIYFEATRDFFLNNARVVDLKSVFLDKETMGIDEIRVKYKDVINQDFGFWPVMQLTYGTPNPGDNLPPDAKGNPVDRKYLDRLAGLTDALSGLVDQMKLTMSEIKTLFATKKQAGDNDKASWNLADYLLSKAGQAKSGNSQFEIVGTTRQNFDAQLKAAVGTVKLPSGFTTLDEYYQWIIAQENYFFLPIEEIGFVMGIRDKLLASKMVDDDAWEKAYGLLGAAYEQKEIAERKATLRAIRVKDGFDAMLAYALGDAGNDGALPAYSNSLDEIFADIQNFRHQAYLQDELFLNVKDFTTLMELKRTSARDDQWETGYEIVERAMRQKRSIVSERPIIEDWYNLYKAEDATAIQTVTGSAGWKPFGAIGQAADLGLMITSPVLVLTEGKRTIEIKLVCLPEGFNTDNIGKSIADKAFPPFTIQLSGEKGFFTVPSGKCELFLTEQRGENILYKIIGIRIKLDENDPAVKAVSAASGDPSLKLILKAQADGRKSKLPYSIYKDVQLIKAYVQVTVEGIKNMTLENDAGEINAKKPFEPFGTEPLPGSRFYFVNNEIAQKKLSTVSLTFEWMGLPVNFSTYYDSYADAKGKKFTAKLQLRRNHVEYLVGDVDLFSVKSSNDVADNLKRAYGDFYFPSDTPLKEGENVLSAHRYFLLELNAPDFQHAAYPALVSRKSIEYAKQLQTGSSTIRPEDFYVNPPYTPLVKSLTLGYTSGVTIDLGSGRRDKLFHLHPFGVQELNDGSSKSFLPVYDDEGSLLIGIDTFDPPDVISLYFQFLEGSANPDVAKPVVKYYYLTMTGWSALDEANILSDTTENLSRSGIVQLTIPEGATLSSTILPGGRYWLKLSVNTDSAGVHDLLAVLAQGIEAVMSQNATQRLSLAPETITAPADNIQSIKSIYQPYASFGGRSGEDDHAFYTRISERLRHKHRVISVWDYERLILHEFPKIYKAKALPVSEASQGIKIVVIPDLTEENGMNPFEPRLSQTYLDKVRNYLLQFASPFAKIQVINPRYLKVKIRASLRLKRGYNESYCRLTINKALQQYLSPWAFEGGDIVFGGKIYANTIVNFLENLESVEYVLGLKFFTSDDGIQYSFVALQDGNVNQVIAPSAETILVSADQHDIDLVENDRIDFDDMSGIGYMKIQLDFKVG